MDLKIHKLSEFDDHKLVVFLNDKASGLRGFISLHRGNSHIPSFGATRYWSYKSEEEALVDSLRLSRSMSYKSAMAGLGYGGAKAALIKNINSQKSHKNFLKAYADKVNYLNGRFVTGTDVGITDDDVKTMRGYCKYFVGVNTDPAKYTALGVYYSVEVCVNEIFGKKSISGRTFAIKGLGKTGGRLLKYLYPHAAKIYVADLDNSKLDEVRKKYPKVVIVDPSQIEKQNVDVYSPCALSNAVNKDNISKLNCKIICGSANNQLEEEDLGKKLFKMGILYAPDYVVNAGGLISVVDEYENGNAKVGRTEGRVQVIKKNLKKIIDTSKKKHMATNLVANEMAEANFNHTTS